MYIVISSLILAAILFYCFHKRSETIEEIEEHRKIIDTKIELASKEKEIKEDQLTIDLIVPAKKEKEVGIIRAEAEKQKKIIAAQAESEIITSKAYAESTAIHVVSDAINESNKSILTNKLEIIKSVESSFITNIDKLAEIGFTLEMMENYIDKIQSKLCEFLIKNIENKNEINDFITSIPKNIKSSFDFDKTIPSNKINDIETNKN